MRCAVLHPSTACVSLAGSQIVSHLHLQRVDMLESMGRAVHRLERRLSRSRPLRASWAVVMAFTNAAEE